MNDDITTAAPKPAPAKPARKPRKPVARYEADQLRRLAGEISSFRQGVPHDHLARLIEDHQLKLPTRPSKTGLYTASMGGVVGKSAIGPLDALANWANAARRAANRMA